MPLSCVSNVKTKREKRCGTEDTSDAVAGFAPADPTKTFVLNSLRKLVSDGYAEWQLRENGDIRIRFHSGETFLLAETTITRIA